MNRNSPPTPKPQPNSQFCLLSFTSEVVACCPNCAYQKHTKSKSTTAVNNHCESYLVQTQYFVSICIFIIIPSLCRNTISDVSTSLDIDTRGACHGRSGTIRHEHQSYIIISVRRKDYDITEQKSHYPPGNHHASHF